MSSRTTTAVGLLPALLLLAACASGEEGPGQVRVQVGGQDIDASAVQGCDDGEEVRYETTPPVVEVVPGADITLTVPESVAERGWGIQVYDERLEEAIAPPLAVPAGEDRSAVINSSDVVPPAFYLLVVDDKGGDCGVWSRAWPIGFVRAGGDLDEAAPSESPAEESPAEETPAESPAPGTTQPETPPAG